MRGHICDSTAFLWNYITPSGKLRTKMTKMRQKVLAKLCENRILCTFSIFILKFFEGGQLGAWLPVALFLDYVPGSTQSMHVSIFQRLDGFVLRPSLSYNPTHPATLKPTTIEQRSVVATVQSANAAYPRGSAVRTRYRNTTACR